MNAYQTNHQLSSSDPQSLDSFPSVMWEGVQVQGNGQPLNEEKLERLADVCRSALGDYSRVACFEFDLKLPPGFESDFGQPVPVFLDLLIQKLHADLQKRQASGGRHYECRVRFLWVPQLGEDKAWNYKVTILLNGDAYFAVANKYRPEDEMCCRIKEAWMQVTQSDWWEIWKYVNFPNSGYWHHNCGAEGAFRNYERLIYRLSSYAFLGDGRMGSSYR